MCSSRDGNRTRMRLKIKTIYGKILTINVEENTNKYISGSDKFGAFVKLKKSDIENSIPMGDKK